MGGDSPARRPDRGHRGSSVLSFPSALVSDRWEFRADRAATPAVFAFGPAEAVALVASESTALGMTGLGLAADADAVILAPSLVSDRYEGTT